MEKIAGLPAGRLRGSDFSSPAVRACALHKIAEIDLPEALGYLETLARAEGGQGGSGEIWSAAQIALREARLRRIEQPSERIAFLEGTLGEKAPVDYWAADQLCNAGSYPSLPLIRESIRRHRSDRADEQIRFCEARVEIVSRNHDRVAAIASFLRADGKPIDRVLTGWAINQLVAMGSRSAEAELERYMNELARLPGSSSDEEGVAYTLFKIRRLLEDR